MPLKAYQFRKTPQSAADMEAAHKVYRNSQPDAPVLSDAALFGLALDYFVATYRRNWTYKAHPANPLAEDESQYHSLWKQENSELRLAQARKLVGFPLDATTLFKMVMLYFAERWSHRTEDWQQNLPENK